ncbi:MAG: flagellar basal body-associated protein FliL [Rhodobacter sp.]|nr:flagellar basal body-associated protein FliL [Rhodobacter sp.]
MMGKLLPVMLAMIGLGGGIGAGLFLRPAAEASGHATPESENSADEADAAAPQYVKMNNQFVVPVVKDGRVVAMVLLSLSLEMAPGTTETVYEREPKLRDVFLQVLFDHANLGGFAGSFTDGSNLVVLRTSLREAAVLVLGTAVSDVLITDIARQDS